MVLLGQVKTHLVQCPASDSGCPVKGSMLLPLVLISLQQFSARGISWAGCVSCSKLQSMSSLCTCPVFSCDLCTSLGAFDSEFHRLAVLKFSFSNWILFVASYISVLGKSVNNRCHGSRCPFTLFWLLMVRFVHSLFVVFSKLRRTCIPSPLYRCALAL